MRLVVTTLKRTAANTSERLFYRLVINLVREEILPDAVTISDLSAHNKESDFRFLDYDKVLVHTLGAIQLLEERLAALENK